MLKRIAYGSAAVLCLALAFHMGAASTGASYVDHSASGIVALSSNDYDDFALDENGQVWRLSGPGGWVPTPTDPIPVPLSEVKLWDVDTIVTFDNVAWCVVAGGHWQSIGPWPQASPVEARSWGAIKSEFR